MGLASYAASLRGNWPVTGEPVVVTPAAAGSTPTLKVEVAFRVPLNNDRHFTLDKSPEGKLDVGVLGDWDNYVDVTDDVMDLSIKRRWNRETGFFEPSSCDFTLLNHDRRYDPLYDEGPYAFGILPMRPVRVSMKFPTDAGDVVFRLFTGWVDDWPSDWNFPLQGKVAVSATDLSKVLAATEIGELVDEIGEGDKQRERISRMWVAAGLPDSWVVADLGSATFDGTKWKTTVLAHLRDIAQSEFGYMMVGGDGVLYVRSRHALITDPRSAHTQTMFGDDGLGGEVPYSKLVVEFNDSRIVNECSVNRSGARAESAQTWSSTRVLGDVAGTPTSKQLYQLQTKSITTIYNSDPQSQSLAQYFVGLFDEAEPQVKGLQVRPRDGAMWAAVLSRELGDRISVRRRPPGKPGTMLQMDGHVTGIQWDIKQSRARTPVDATVTFDTHPARHISDLFKLDDVTFGRLDVNRLAP